jgi:hypothetical protein
MVFFVLLQIWGVRSQGHDWPIVFREAWFWLVLWPGFFLTILFFTGGWRRRIQKRAFLKGERWATQRQADARGGVVPSERCPKCGALNENTQEKCRSCGLTIRKIEIVHPVELLAGAKHSAPSFLYVLAVLVSMGVGALTLLAIGEERFLENLFLLIGGFMGGAAVSLTVLVFFISRWAERKYGR